MSDDDQNDFPKALEEIMKNFSSSGGVPTGRIRFSYEARDGKRFRVEIEDDGKGGYTGKVIVWDKNGNGKTVFDGKIPDDILKDISDGCLDPNDPFSFDPLDPTTP